VDDVLVSEYWSGHAFARSNDLATTDNPVAGSRHRIRVDYFDAASLARLELHWTQPNGTSGIVPGDKLFPRYGLPTTTIAHDTTPGAPAEVTTSAYARPENGLATSTTADPGGLNLTTTTDYEAPGAGFLRRTRRALPAGNAWSYAYYANTESRANPCDSSASANQAGMVRTTTGPDPDGAGPGVPRVEEAVYDAAGRVVASRLGSGGWACVAYDARGRPTSASVPAWGAEPGRRIAYNYAVGANPLVTSVADPVGTITTTVDLLGRVVSYTDTGGATTTSTYDQAGRLVETSGPAGAQRYGYDPAGRPTTQFLDGATVATATYDAGGELAEVSYPSGTGNAGNATAGTIGRDRTGALASLAWKRADGSPLANDAVTRSQAGKVLDQLIDGADADPAAPNLTYDAAGACAPPGSPAGPWPTTTPPRRAVGWPPRRPRTPTARPWWTTGSPPRTATTPPTSW
jgi:YD repeat-containing protein